MDWLYLLEIVLMLLAGLTAGFLNTVSGGGSLITLPVLIFWGLPGLEANATNRVAILSQNIFAVAGFRSKKVELPKPYIYYLALMSLIGGVIGTVLALYFPNDAFNKMLSIIMILIAVSLLKSSKRTSDILMDEAKKKQIWGSISFFFLGIYGGFLQAGIGFLTIILMTQLHNYSLVKSNYIKVFVALVYTGCALLIFAIMDVIHWEIGLVLAIGQGVGGWFTSRWQVDKGDKWIRPIIVTAVFGLAIKLWFF